jgi:ribosomal protein S18 acetylase RimI-like enzyme
MDHPVTFRPVTADDDAFLYQVYASTREEEMGRLPWTAAEKTAFLRMQFSAQRRYYHQHFPGASFQIILLEGDAIGRFYVSHGANDILVIDIALLPQYRNRGIGGAIMHEVLGEAAQSGKPVHVHVEHFNRALRFYERLGFSKIGGDSVYFLMEWRPRGA